MVTIQFTRTGLVSFMQNKFPQEFALGDTIIIWGNFPTVIQSLPTPCGSALIADTDSGLMIFDPNTAYPHI